jgi:hypothetical protein
MDIRALKELAQAFTVPELDACVLELENTGKCRCTAKTDTHEAMSDLLQALEVRSLVDGGMSLQDAVREFSKRVRLVLR